MAIAIVAGTSVSANSFTTATTSAVDTTGCTLLIAVISCFSTGGAAVFSDSKSNTWTKLTLRDSGNTTNLIAYAQNPTVGSGHTFSGTSGTFFGSICVSGFSGTATTSVFDQQNGATTAGATTLATGSVTPSANNELIIASAGSASVGQPYTIGSGFTIAVQDPGGSSYPSGLAYLIQTSASAINPTWTFNASAEAEACIATFKAPAAAAGVSSKIYQTNFTIKRASYF